MKFFVAFVGAWISSVAHGHASSEDGFPMEATPISTDIAATRVAGNTYRGTTSEGADWVIKIERNGDLIWYRSNGSNSGHWYIDGDQFCSQMRSGLSYCNETRLHDETVYLKRRQNEEIVKLVPIRDATGELKKYIGRWNIRGQLPRWSDTSISIDDASSSTWNIHRGALEIRANPCWGFVYPIVVLLSSGDELILSALGSSVVPGCADLGLGMSWADENTLRNKSSRTPVVLTRP